MKSEEEIRERMNELIESKDELMSSELEHEIEVLEWVLDDE